jgi:hypothetical protein
MHDMVGRGSANWSLEGDIPITTKKAAILSAIAACGMLSAAWVSGRFKRAEAQPQKTIDYPVRMALPKERPFSLILPISVGMDSLGAPSGPPAVASIADMFTGSAAPESVDSASMMSPNGGRDDEAGNPKSGPLALSFDLAHHPNLEEPVEVKKQLWLSGELVGQIGVLIEGNGTLLVSTSEIREIAPQLPAEEFGDDKFVSFKRLRELGVDIKYDAVRDALIWNKTGSP